MITDDGHKISRDAFEYLAGCHAEWLEDQPIGEAWDPSEALEYALRRMEQ